MRRSEGLILLVLFLVYLLCGCAEVPKEMPKEVVAPPKPEVKLVPPEVPGVLKLPHVPITREWRYIVVHHSASPSGSAEAFDYYHRVKRGWDRGLGYHFVIGNGNGTGNGQIEVGHRWVYQIEGAHAGLAEYNQHGIGICLVGNFDEDYPTHEQLESLIVLVRELQRVCHIPSENVVMHRHIKTTDCPGRNFPYYEVLTRLLQ